MSEKLCPLLKEPCIEHRCKFYVHLLGQNPQTAKVIDHWDCSIAWIPVLLIENAQQGRQTGAAVESFRNEMVKQNQVAQSLIATGIARRLSHTGNGEYLRAEIEQEAATP